MLTVLRNRIYATLFAAQIIALIGTGLLTVALGLLAFDIAGGEAGRVLGIALTIKMVAYVGISPITTALTTRLPRRAVLISADLIRAGAAAFLPFVTETWQIYLLIFLLQAASATFTPTFQALIPVVVPNENEYTRALSLSRLAYDLEALFSPLLAAVLLTMTSFHNLFAGTVVGFIASAALVASTRLPSTEPPAASSFTTRLNRGLSVFRSSSDLRGLQCLNLTVAAMSSMVIVNTVVVVEDVLGRPQHDVALLLGVYGGGSMIVALYMPRLLDRRDDRRIMTFGGVIACALLAGTAGAISILPELASSAPLPGWILLLLLWTLLGAATSCMLTPSARLLRRASNDSNRPAVFAAQFALSHACFLLCYPVAGFFGSVISLPWTALILATVGLLGAVKANWWFRTPSAAGIASVTAAQ